MFLSEYGDVHGGLGCLWKHFCFGHQPSRVLRVIDWDGVHSIDPSPTYQVVRMTVLQQLVRGMQIVALQYSEVPLKDLLVPKARGLVGAPSRRLGSSVCLVVPVLGHPTK